jgi:prepilin-type N-terminal cleavage/methylation domain-containing protein
VTELNDNLTRQRFSPRGFTLAELIVGLLLLAIVGGATAAVASAVTRGWQLGETNGAATLTMGRTMLRIQDRIQRAKFLGQCRPGSVSSPDSVPGAAILFWRDDANGDGLMQFEETQLLEYDPAAKTLVVTEPAYPTAAIRAAYNGPHPTSMLTGATAIEDYKGMQYKATHTITRNVQGASFNVITPTTASQRPAFEFRLKFNTPNGPAVDYGTATLRSPLS